jgi:hypothetical protein
MNFNSPIIFFILTVLILISWKKIKDINIFKPTKERLIKLLVKAEKMASHYSGGYSGEHLSAEEFHQDLKTAIKEYKNGDDSQINEFYFWFAPTCAWDDFVGQEGENLGNQIFDILTRMKK